MKEQSAPSSTAVWARRYIETFNLALVSIEPGEKVPQGLGWNKPGGYMTSADAADIFWQANPLHNLGVVLGPSRVCSLDVDDVEWTRFVLFELLGLDLDALAIVYPTVVGNPTRFRVLFQVPEGVELNRHSLAWPNRKDPDGSIWKAVMARAKMAREAGDAQGEADAKAEAEPYKRFTVFELRAGLVQDVLPPSIHPGTGKPYIWRTPPRSEGLPLLTDDLLNIWLNWDIFKRDAEAACPWRPKPAHTTPRAKRSQPATGDRPSVIDEFNRVHDLEDLLRAYGYVKKGAKWLYPQSSTGLPGVSISDGKLYSHHGADPLANGHQNDPFDVFCLLEHNGDVSAATKAAARLLGMEIKRRPPEPLGELPPPPTAAEVPESGTASEDRGQGVEAVLAPFTVAELMRRFALVEGTTHVWDTDKVKSMRKSAFEALVGKGLAKEWIDDPRKRLIAADQVREFEQAKKIAGKKSSAQEMSPMERYVYIDGTKRSGIG